MIDWRTCEDWRNCPCWSCEDLRGWSAAFAVIEARRGETACRLDAKHESAISDKGSIA